MECRRLPDGRARGVDGQDIIFLKAGLGGKRAFLPNSVEREGDWLHVQLMYFGRPWRVDARRVTAAPGG